MYFTSEFLKGFRKEFDEAMAPLKEKYDLTIELGTITFSQERFSVKMTVNAGRDREDIARANFDADAWKFADIGIQEGMYKRIFIGADGEKYAIIRLNPRYKQPLIAIQLNDEKTYRCGRNFVKAWTESYYAQGYEPSQE